MKPVKFSQHAYEQMSERGASESEVVRLSKQGNERRLNVADMAIVKISSIIVCGADELLPSSKFWPSLLKKWMR